MTNIDISDVNITVSYESSSKNSFECIFDSTDKFTLIIQDFKGNSLDNYVKCDKLLPVESYTLKIQTECTTNQTSYSLITSKFWVPKC